MTTVLPQQIVANSNVSLIIDGINTTFTWIELAEQLTKYNCDDSICYTEIASNHSVNILMLVLMAALVFFMQAGFTFLEVGSVHVKNTKNILTKNVADICIGALSFYSVGFAIAFVEGNGFIGNAGFFLQGSYFNDSPEPEREYNGYHYSLWTFEWAFAACSTAVVSGAIAERVAFSAYMVYALFATSFMYPVVAHWIWSTTGWASAFKAEDRLFSVGVIDYSGSGVVHVTGGLAALVGCIIIGPRKGRFDGNGQPLPMPRQSAAFQTAGAMILWFGWYGFNCGSVLTFAGNKADAAAKVSVNMTIAAATGAVGSVLWGKLLGEKVFSPLQANNGILAGLVAINAGCSTVEPEGAVVIGFISSIVYWSSSVLLLKWNIDDVVNAVPVHFFAGAWGMIAAGLFSTEKNYRMNYGNLGVRNSCGIFYTCHGNHWRQLAANVVALLAIIGWVGVLSGLLFFSLRCIGILRVTADVEERGIDASEHGGLEDTTTQARPVMAKSGSYLPSDRGVHDYEGAVYGGMKSPSSSRVQLNEASSNGSDSSYKNTKSPISALPRVHFSASIL